MGCGEVTGGSKVCVCEREWCFLKVFGEVTKEWVSGGVIYVHDCLVCVCVLMDGYVCILIE